MTDWISRRSPSGTIFLPRKFQGFAEIKEALIADRMQAGFLVAPLAVALRSQGVPIRVVYLGHRYGSAAVVAASGPVREVRDMRGKTWAIPSRFSDEFLITLSALERNGLAKADVHFVEMPPPDVAGALAVGAIDGFTMGEPYPAQAEMGGYGRILFQAREYWPDYMSCVMVVREDAIAERPEAVQELVDGVARSGLWLDQGVENREHASEFVGRYYFQQAPALLRWVLTRDLERVIYTRLSPRRADFDLVRDLMLRQGLLERSIEFDEYVDVRFAEATAGLTPWRYRAGDAAAE